MAHLANFSFEICYEIFTEDASLPLRYYGAKKSKMTKNSNQGGSCQVRACVCVCVCVCVRVEVPGMVGELKAK